MSYLLQITPSAHKQLRKLPVSIQKRVRSALEDLAVDPFAAGKDVKKLKGQHSYRLRVGSYRVIYDIHSGTLTVLVLEVGHRQGIYH